MDVYSKIRTLLLIVGWYNLTRSVVALCRISIEPYIYAKELLGTKSRRYLFYSAFAFAGYWMLAGVK
jgi:hypothetical protein